MIYSIFIVIFLLLIIAAATTKSKKVTNLNIEYIYDRTKLVIIKNDDQYSLYNLVQEYNKIAKSYGHPLLKKNGEKKMYDKSDWGYYVHKFKDPSQGRIEAWIKTTGPGDSFKLYALKNSIDNKISTK